MSRGADRLEGAPPDQSQKKIEQKHRGFANAAVDHSRLVNNDNTFPDVAFSWEQDSVLSAHQVMLKARVPHMLADAKQSKKKKNCWVIDINKNLKPTPNSTHALNVVLLYLYSGEIDFDNYNPFMATEVLAIANAYNMEHLAQMNIKYLQEQVNDNNVFDMFKYAHRIGVEVAKHICIDYALMHTEFFTSKKAKEVGLELYQEATSAMVEHWLQKRDPTPFEKKVTAPNTVVDDFTRLYASRGDSGDIIFKIQDKNVKAHKCVVSTYSAELDELIRANPHIVVFDPKYARISERAFEGFLQYIYFRTTAGLKLLYACQLHQFAMDFKLHQVQQVLERQMDVLECDNRSAVYLLEVAYTEMEHDKKLRKSLRKKGITHIVDNMDKIDFSPVELMPSVIGTDIVLAIQKAVQASWGSVSACIKEGINTTPITANFPGNRRVEHSSERSEIDPSERSEASATSPGKHGKTTKRTATKTDRKKATKRDTVSETTKDKGKGDKKD